MTALVLWLTGGLVGRIAIIVQPLNNLLCFCLFVRTASVVVKEEDGEGVRISKLNLPAG